jgi:hypothetical protein
MKAQAGCYAGGTTPRQSGPGPCMSGLDVTRGYIDESPRVKVRHKGIVKGYNSICVLLVLLCLA